MRILILAAGKGPPTALLKRLARHADLIIAADGGVRLARAARLPLHHVVGDGDSLTRHNQRWLAMKATPTDWHPVAKDQTDLELAIDLALAQRPAVIEVVGAWGGRADHTLSNLFLLERVETCGAKAHLWAGWERLRVLKPGKYLLESAFMGQRVSLIPLSHRVDGVCTQGLTYILDQESLHRPQGRGVSNEVVLPHPMLEFTRGTLVLVQTFERTWLAQL